MRVIDKTPFQDERGNISLIARIQGTLRYGFSWYPELEAQKAVLAQLDRVLDKSFVAIRNFTLPDSEIVIPIILIGPGSISMILASPVKGHFEARGDQWSTVSDSGASVPVKRNLIDLTSKFTRVFQKYLSNHRINVSVPIEPVLIASNPGAQIDSFQPVVRVLRSDAIKQFANSLMQMRVMMRPDMIVDLAEHIVNPRMPEENEPESVGQPVSRARAIFNAARETGAGDGVSNAADGRAVPKNLRETSPARPLRRGAPSPRKGFLGMTRTQAILLGAMIIIQVCILAGGVVLALIFFS
jgi:hypothetical protein